ncbi:hypothetical protein AMECASPLE_018258 [Ameca splendens]|uniref:Uncharacterized protein n=1 Tax=Ameca splendens TaxID=208324 RepID=A0ABV0YQT2_9TELE
MKKECILKVLENNINKRPLSEKTKLAIQTFFVHEIHNIMTCCTKRSSFNVTLFGNTCWQQATGISVSAGILHTHLCYRSNIRNEGKPSFFRAIKRFAGVDL